MSDIDVIPEKEDTLDKGPMPSYDDKTKPECPEHGETWVIAVGNDRKWKWKCINCQRIL